MLEFLDFQTLLLLFASLIICIVHRIQQPIPKLRTLSFLPIKLFATTIAMKNCKTCCNWSNNSLKCEFIFSELVIGSDEQDITMKQKLPKLVNSLKRSLESMVLSEFLSYNFKISTKSWMPPVSLESLAFLKRGYISSRTMVFLPFSFSPPISTMVFMVGFKLQARTRSPM